MRCFLFCLILATAASLSAAAQAPIPSVIDWKAPATLPTYLLQQVHQQYALTVSKDQSSTLISGRQITLSDGTHVRLRFHDNKRKANLVVVRETPYPEATR